MRLPMVRSVIFYWFLFWKYEFRFKVKQWVELWQLNCVISALVSCTFLYLTIPYFRLNWFNLFLFLILMADSITILTDCMIFLSVFIYLDLKRKAISTDFFLRQLRASIDSGGLCLQNTFFFDLYGLNGFNSIVNWLLFLLLFVNRFYISFSSFVTFFSILTAPNIIFP